MANNEWDRDRERNREWDRDRDREWERERDWGYDPERRRHELGGRGEGGYQGRRATDMAAAPDGAGKDSVKAVSAASAGRANACTRSMEDKGSGEHGYSGRETGGGMSLYSSAPERERYSQGAGMGNYYESRGEDRERFERDRGERQRFEGRDRDREEWGREWGGQGFSGREGGWGGYGSYDRERGGWERASAGYDRDRGHTEMWRGRGGESWEHGRPGEEFRREYSAGRNYGGYGSYGAYSGQGTRWNEGQNWGERGRFMGRGPRNWQRSDERIKEDINERLTEHPDIDASDIEVEVVAGEVTLRGKVDDRHAKRLAEDIAEGVFGVRDVRNEIKVSRGFFGAISDAITGRSDEDDRERERRETTSAAQRGVTAGTSTGTGSSSGNVTGNSSSAQKQGDLTGAKK